jgi:E3 ubiquitin-protein ligase XIAP/baculoviral IAP repeat-containing protein 7/8
LAKAGFFYFNKEEEVQCAFCLGIVKEWQSTDDPFLVHQSKFPLCPFISGLSCGNVPLTSFPKGLNIGDFHL